MNTTTAGRLSWTVVTLAVLVALVLPAAACGGDDEPRADRDRIVLTPPSDGAGHTHAPGEGDPVPVGDGTRAAAGGYRLADLRLPRGTDGPGDLTFRIVDQDDEPVVDFTEQQTELLHLYVVRTDYAIYRHVHPTLGKDGRWSAPVDLGDPGDYRVIADFQPTGADEPVVLGDTGAVPGRWTPAGLTEGGDDGVVRVEVDGAAAVGTDGRLHLVVTTLDGAPVTLGTYLGTSAHVSGFRVGGPPSDGVFVHVHPYGEPEVADDGTRLTFHTTFERAGDYRLFVQVRVDGLLHTVPVTATVEP